jgi:hypothetical protein
MSSINISGDTSGAITLAAPAVSGVNTQTLVAATGTLAPIVSGTAQATTSGTAITFTSIPSWVKRITVLFDGVSTSGSSFPALRVGSGSIDTTSYLSTSTVSYGVNLASTQGTSSYVIYSDVAGNALSGSIQLNNISGNIWIASGVISIYSVNGVIMLGGTHTTSGALDRVQLTTINGTDTFDAGSINILYE